MPFARPKDNLASTLGARRAPGDATLTVRKNRSLNWGAVSPANPVRVSVVSVAALDPNNQIVDGSKVATFTATGVDTAGSPDYDTLSGVAFESGYDQEFLAGDYVRSLVTEKTVTELQDAVAGNDNRALHRSGAETVTGPKVFNATGGAVVPLTLNRSAGTDVPLLDIRSSQPGTPLVRVWSDLGGFPQPRVSLNDAGAPQIQTWITVSGAFTGSGDTFRVVQPTSDPYMIGVWSDVGGPAVVARGSGAAGSYLYGGMNAAGSYVWGVDEAGKLLWGSAASVGALDTNLYRAEADTLATDDALVAGGKQIVRVVRALAAGAGSTTELGTVTFPGGGAGVVRLAVAANGAGYSSAKIYEVPVQYGSDATWYELTPQKALAPYGGYANPDLPDWKVDVSYPGGAAAFRVRNLSPTLTATVTAAVTAEGPYQRWVDSAATATGVAAPDVLASQTVPLAPLPDGVTGGMRRPSLYWNTTKSLPAVVDPSGATAYLTAGPVGAAGLVQIAGAGLFASDATFSFDSGTKTLSAGNNLVVGTRRVYTFSRALAASADSTVEVGTLAAGGTSAAVEMTVEAGGGGYAVAKAYSLGLAYGGNGAWHTVAPLHATGAYGGPGGPDFDLELNASGSTFLLRLRNRTAVAATVYVRLVVDNNGPTVTLTSGTATGVAAAAGWNPQTNPTPVPVMTDAQAQGARGPAFFLSSSHLDASSLPKLCRLNADGTVTVIG